MKAEDLLRRQEQLAGARATWESHWQEVADYVLPRRADIVARSTRGAKRTEKLFDATAIHANELLAAALHAMLTNPATRWFDLRLAQPAGLRTDPAARLWLQHAADMLIEAFTESNLAPQLHELYLDLGCFGTGCLYVEEEAGGLRFSTRHPAEIFVAESAHGTIDTVYRRFVFTARQAVQQFGAEALGPRLRGAAAKTPDAEFGFVHAVLPRAERGPGKAGNRNLPYASIYVSVDDRAIVSESGYHEFPYMVPRWAKVSGEVYGRSPGMTVLPDVKMLNEICRTTLRAAQKAVDPPLMMPDDGFLGPVRAMPGGINYYRAGTADRIEPLVTGGNVGLGLEIEEQRRALIRSAFFIDLLQLAGGPQMTATEVLQRTDEKLRLLGPLLGRLQSELLRPLIIRAVGVLGRAGRLPPAPPSLLGASLEIDYISPIARAQRAEEVQAMSRAWEAVAPFAGANPEMLDLIDGDRLLRHVVDRLGGPAGVLRSNGAVAKLRRERKQAAAGAIGGGAHGRTALAQDLPAGLQALLGEAGGAPRGANGGRA